MHSEAGVRHVLVLYNVKHHSREYTGLERASGRGKTVVIRHDETLETGTFFIALC